MPESLDEASTGSGELIFPDDATGKQYRLRERNVYDAEEVRDEIGNDDVPRFGRWLPVTFENGTDQDDAWLSCPAALIDELLGHGIENGTGFEIVTIQKPGSDPSNPYEVEIRVVDDTDQDRL